MRLYNNLPLTPLLYQSESIYYYYEKMIYQSIETDIVDGALYFTDPVELTKQQKQKWRDAEKLSRKTFDNLYNCQIDSLNNSDFIVKAGLAGMLHDCAKCMDNSKKLSICNENNIITII